MVSIKLQLVRVFERLLEEIKDEILFIYHYMILFTPLEYDWGYTHFLNDELSVMRLIDEQGIEIARFDAVSRLLFLSGDITSSQYYVRERVGIFRIQRKILKYKRIEKKDNPFLGNNFVPLRFERIEDEVEKPELLDPDKFGWHVRDEQVWLEGPGATCICKMSLDGTQYKYRRSEWKEVTHQNEEAFRRHIERAYKWGKKEA